MRPEQIPARNRFQGQQRRFAMSDLRFDPEMRRIAMNDYGARSMWAAIAIILLLVGGLIVAGTYSAGDTQIAQTLAARDHRLGESDPYQPTELTSRSIEFRETPARGFLGFGDNMPIVSGATPAP
jgi:hypothetical protein